MVFSFLAPELKKQMKVTILNDSNARVLRAHLYLFIQLWCKLVRAIFELRRYVYLRSTQLRGADESDETIKMHACSLCFSSAFCKVDDLIDWLVDHHFCLLSSIHTFSSICGAKNDYLLAQPCSAGTKIEDLPHGESPLSFRKNCFSAQTVYFVTYQNNTLDRGNGCHTILYIQ